ncbi:MAG TPA: S46 family peptidase, partial [Myxococcaceae bacterium]|nr:S46 family peptidase [Myxococcaceae bacterium]
GGTARNWTITELEYERDTALPERLMNLAQSRGELTEFQQRGAEQKRVSNADLFYTENGFKALKGRREALVDAAFFGTKVAAEQALRAKVNADPAKKKLYGDAWDNVAKALGELKEIRKPLGYLAYGRGFNSELFHIAQGLVRAGDERLKDSTVRLEEYSDARLPQLKAHLLSPAPIYRDFEIMKLTASLTKLREELGADNPTVRIIMGKKSPQELATELVNGTKLVSDPAGLKLRAKLWEGGKAAVDASNDPLIAFAKLVDPDARSVRKHYEDDIRSVVNKNEERIAKARFDFYGTSVYPDATFTARLSYGTVKGYTQSDGRAVRPVTDFAGAFDRATGRDPFKLPDSWDKARASLDLSTPFDFCSDNDIIGGNSGSPVVNKDAEIVGLVFDGNIESLGGEYGFDAKVNRTVAVDSPALIQALGKIYGAQRLVSELLPGSSAPTGAR